MLCVVEVSAYVAGGGVDVTGGGGVAVAGGVEVAGGGVVCESGLGGIMEGGIGTFPCGGKRCASATSACDIMIWYGLSSLSKLYMQISV